MPERDPRALLLCVVGLLVGLALVPVWVKPGAPADLFVTVLLLVQGVLGISGFGIAAVGYRSYRSGDLRPAVTVGVCVAVLAGVWTLGYVVETSVASVAPHSLWFVAPIIVGPPLGYLLGYRRGVIRS